MKVQIVGRHFEVSDRMRARIEKEAAKLERFFDRIIDCQVLVGAEKQRRIVEVLVNVHAHTLKATRDGSSVYQALEEAMDRVKVQLKKHHNKLQERRGGGIKAARAAV